MTLFSFTVVLTALTSSSADPEPALIWREREMMGTRVSIALVETGAARDVALRERAFAAAFEAFDRVDKVMNEWRVGSPLSRINAAAGSERFVEAPADLCTLLEVSLSAARRTGGLFDPTWAALSELWRFDGEPRKKPPPAHAVRAACKKVSHGDVELRTSEVSAGCGVRLKYPGMRLGLGGVAKGWAVDHAVAALRRLGLRDFLVQAGGDLYASGKRGARRWQVGIRDPRGPREAYFARLEVEDAAFSTSGDYERFFIADGRRYHHLIDPRTCYPATASRSATVLARSALDAEFLTKATFILGGKPALELARQFKALVVLVATDNTVHVSPELRDRLELSPPTP